MALDALFGFTLDAAATKDNAKCARFFTKEDDALTRYWDDDGGAVWLNPPYSRDIDEWVAKARFEAETGGVTAVVVLLPACTDTKWFDVVDDHAAWLPLRGRLKFKGAEASAPFPSLIAIFGEVTAAQIQALERRFNRTVRLPKAAASRDQFR